jgi:rhamnogalacturonyl hydrolase YesR
MKRREFTNMSVVLATGAVILPLLSQGEGIKNAYGTLLAPPDGLPGNLPANIKQMILNVSKTQFSAMNTDWDGSIQIEGLLRFAKRGYKHGLEYANNWFNYHVEHDGKLTDEEYYKQYDGPKARIMRDGPLTFVIYSANLGVAFPVHELYKQTQNPVAKRVCIDIADAILQYAGRDRFGMLAHDDFNYTAFAIPDTAYWGTRANAIAAELSQDNKGLADVYWKQSFFQLDQGIKYFLDKSKSLVHTGLFKGEPSTTYWCRSQGWLLWAISGLLRYLPPSNPHFPQASAAMKVIADGAVKYQTKNGALNVLVNEPGTPEEVTSTAMVVASVKEGMRNGWIPKQYDELCSKGWGFIQKSVDTDGKVHNAYTGWAVTAEDKKTDLMDQNFRGFVPGIIMLAADEMTR